MSDRLKLSNSASAPSTRWAKSELSSGLVSGFRDSRIQFMHRDIAFPHQLRNRHVTSGDIHPRAEFHCAGPLGIKEKLDYGSGDMAHHKFGLLPTFGYFNAALAASLVTCDSMEKLQWLSLPSGCCLEVLQPLDMLHSCQLDSLHNLDGSLGQVLRREHPFVDFKLSFRDEIFEQKSVLTNPLQFVVYQYTA